MFTQGADQTDAGSVFRSESPEIGKRPASRGHVALFTDSFRGAGIATANRLVRDGYAVRLYLTADDGIRRASSP